MPQSNAARRRSAIARADRIQRKQSPEVVPHAAPNVVLLNQHTTKLFELLEGLQQAVADFLDDPSAAIATRWAEALAAANGIPPMLVDDAEAQRTAKRTKLTVGLPLPEAPVQIEAPLPPLPWSFSTAMVQLKRQLRAGTESLKDGTTAQRGTVAELETLIQCHATRIVLRLLEHRQRLQHGTGPGSSSPEPAANSDDERALEAAAVAAVTPAVVARPTVPAIPRAADAPDDAGCSRPGSARAADRAPLPDGALRPGSVLTQGSRPGSRGIPALRSRQGGSPDTAGAEYVEVNLGVAHSVMRPRTADVRSARQRPLGLEAHIGALAEGEAHPPAESPRLCGALDRHLSPPNHEAGLQSASPLVPAPPRAQRHQYVTGGPPLKPRVQKPAAGGSLIMWSQAHGALRSTPRPPTDGPDVVVLQRSPSRDAADGVAELRVAAHIAAAVPPGGRRPSHTKQRPATAPDLDRSPRKAAAEPSKPATGWILLSGLPGADPPPSGRVWGDHAKKAFEGRGRSPPGPGRSPRRL